MRTGRGTWSAGLIVAGVLLAGCGGAPERRTAPTTLPPEAPTRSAITAHPSTNAPGLKVTDVATGLEVPWGLAFLPDGSALVTERDSGRLLQVTAAGQVTKVATISEAAPVGEAGLLGVAVSPDFARDRQVFLYVTTKTDNRVLRARFESGRLSDAEPILDGIPNGFVHDGGRLAFGPDGYLYVSTGESGQPDLSQDLDSLGGKILRITTEGEPAPGNPEPDSPIWSWGHRNVQGLAFDDDGRLWASEFGASSFDELNLILAGGNYGWPEVEGSGGNGRFVEPEIVWSTDEASPSGLAFRDGKLWMAALYGRRLWRVDLNGAQASRPTDFLVGTYGRLRTVVVAPDGALWVTTSNRDGRGEPAPGDDRILRVEP